MESDLPQTNLYQCPPKGGEDLDSPPDGGGSANDANVDRPAEFPVCHQGTIPLGEQEGHLQSAAEVGGPASHAPERPVRRRKKTR
jgi:hypothetical protein